MKRTMTTDLDKQTFTGACGGVVTAVLILLYVTGRNIHRTVTRYPWACIVVVITISVILNVLLYVSATSRQRAAEEQRDSIAYEYERITNTTARGLRN